MVPVRAITDQRLASWTQLLMQGHATPIVLIGCGHDHKSGELVLCVPEGVPDDMLIGALLFALETLKPGTIPQRHGESTKFERRNH